MIVSKPSLKAVAGITADHVKTAEALKSTLKIICVASVPKTERGYGRKKGKPEMQLDMLAPNQVYKSVYFDQDDILRAIMALHCPDGFEADITYGNGAFYRAITSPALKFDIDPQCDGVTQASSDSLPLADSSIKSVVFDPPFLTYVRAGREGNGKMIMAKRFAGYWTYGELEQHYRATLKECTRVLKKGGVMVFKCQDIIHNHRMHCTHANVIGWASEYGLSLLDLFVLPAMRRLPAPNRKGTQKHARIFHSYFLVFKC